MCARAMTTGRSRADRWHASMRVLWFEQAKSLEQLATLTALNRDVVSLSMIVGAGGRVDAPQLWNAVAGLPEPVAALERLLEAGGSLERRDAEGRALLHWASWAYLDKKQERAGMIHALLRRGADIEAVDIQGRTPLMLAAYADRADSIDALLRGGANIDTRDWMGRNAVMWAAIENSPKSIRALTQHADLEARDKSGMTALLLAAHHKKKKAVEALLKAGASPFARNMFGQALQDCCDDSEIRKIVASFKANHPARSAPTSSP